MHGGRARSVALALAQTAPGPSARPAAVCWPLAAKWGQFAHRVFVAIWGIQRLAQGEEDHIGAVGEGWGGGLGDRV